MRSHLCLLVLLGGLVFQPAFAGPASDRRNDREERHAARGHREAGRMSPSEAAQIAQQRHGGGRVLSVEAADNGYRVKLLQRGDVQVVFIPVE